MLKLIRSFVEDLAEEVFECGDGREALSAYRKHQPDWVLMDIKMKDVDGIAATKQIRDLYPHASVLIVTGYNDRKLREAARKAGACGYVVKEDLLLVRQILCDPR